LPALEFLLRHAERAITPTASLSASLRRFVASVDVIPNALDERLWFSPIQPRVSGGEAMRFLVMGTRTHAGDLEIIAPAARRLLAEFGDRVRFDVIGCVPRGVRADWYRSLRIPATAREYPAFVRWLRRRHRWHVGLAPLVEHPFNAAKSAIKYLDYGALGLAGVFSDVPAYSGVVRQLETGLLTGNHAEAWYEALRTLVLQPEFRQRLATAALHDVRERHGLARIVPLWTAALGLEAAPKGLGESVAAT
jgi:hypothetical protein